MAGERMAGQLAANGSPCCLSEQAPFARPTVACPETIVIARGSATETAAIIDTLRVRHLAPEAACVQARSLAVRVVQMLTKLINVLG
jgi:hypothetical protein